MSRTSLRDKLRFIFGGVFGILGTIGGWWFLLSIFGFQPKFPEPFTLLNLIIGLVTIGTLSTALIAGGPIIIHDAIKEYLQIEEASE